MCHGNREEARQIVQFGVGSCRLGELKKVSLLKGKGGVKSINEQKFAIRDSSSLGNRENRRGERKQNSLYQLGKDGRIQEEVSHKNESYKWSWS